MCSRYTEKAWENSIPPFKRGAEFVEYITKELEPILEKEGITEYDVGDYLNKKAFDKPYYAQSEFTDPEIFLINQPRNIDFLKRYASRDLSFIKLWQRFMEETDCGEDDELTDFDKKSLIKVYNRCIEIDKDCPERSILFTG